MDNYESLCYSTRSRSAAPCNGNDGRKRFALVINYLASQDKNGAICERCFCMLDQKNTQTIQTIISDILDRIGVSYSLEAQEGSDVTWFVARTDDSALLIGEGGKNLIALNYLIRRLAEKKLKEEFQFVLDINDYHKKRIEEVKDLARMHAQRVRYFKKDIEMRPMNSYERRIVHTVLQEYPDIETESVGAGLERRVVIKPLI